MNWLKKLLHLRRQNDRVKLALLFFALALYFGVSIGVQAMGAAQELGKPVEYVLQSPFTGAVLDTGMQKIREMDGVVGVSRQTERTLKTGEKALTVTVLEKTYLTDCYDLSITGTGNHFWLSRETFRSSLGSATSPARCSYQVGDKAESGSFTLAESLPPEESLAVTWGTSVELGNSSTLRVMLGKRDLSGADVRHLESLSFTVQNRELLLEQRYQTELLLTRLWDGTILTLLALAAGIGFWKGASSDPI